MTPTVTDPGTGGDARVAIVGAGPHGLAAALHLVDADPGLRDGLVVLDPAGGWLRAWDERFARLGIEHLRSPGVHHPGCNPHQLAEWSERHGLDSARPWPYALPATSTFRGFCAHLVAEAGLTEHVVPTRVRQITPGPYGARLVLANGTDMVAEHVIVATDPARRCTPGWVGDLSPVPAESVAHGDDVDLQACDLDGQHVTVVGGGLTAGHLAAGAVERGATVTLVGRRPLREQMFDTDPTWLGPRQLDPFHRVTDPGERLRMALAARDGGSMPPWMTRRLRDAEEAGYLRVLAPGRICGAHLADHRVRLVLGDGSPLDTDRVWLATGTRPDVTADRVTAGLQATHPTQLVDGWPILDAHLRWPGTDVHLLGRLAMPAIGPAAGNLWGARIGAARIAAHIAWSGREHRTVRLPAERRRRT
jgi:cation diffusion facilitator CzcD-associated flavoprotein CzcO